MRVLDFWPNSRKFPYPVTETLIAPHELISNQAIVDIGQLCMAIKIHQPDVLIGDLLLPGNDIWDQMRFLTKIRRAFRDLPIIVCNPPPRRASLLRRNPGYKPWMKLALDLRLEFIQMPDNPDTGFLARKIAEATRLMA